MSSVRTYSQHLLALILLGISTVFSGCATPSRVVSPGPTYAGASSVERLMIYVFIDARPEYIHPAFRRTVEENLAGAFGKASVPSQQRWFLDTSEGQRLRQDLKNRTLGNTTFVSIGRTIHENLDAESSFKPSHRLVVFPKDTYKSGSGAILDIKWDIVDASSGNVEWSVYTRTPVLSKDMKDDEAAAAARGLADTIIEEMKARSVLRR